MSTQNNATIDTTIVLLSVVSIFLPWGALGLFAVICAIRLFSKKQLRENIFNFKYNNIIFIFLLLTTVTSIFSKNIYGVMGSLAYTIIILYFIYLQTVITDEAWQNGLKLCVFFSIPCCAFALCQKFWHFRFIKHYRPASVFANANYFGTVIEFVILICVYLMITNKLSKKNGIIILITNGFALYLCDCMSAYLSIFFGIITILFLIKRKNLFFIMTGVTAVSVPLAFKLDFIFPRLNLSYSSGQRFGIWKQALMFFMDSPFFGTGSFSYIFLSLKNAVKFRWHSHNILIDCLVNFGVIGTILLVFYFGVIIAKNTEIFKIEKSKSALVFGILIAVLIHGITDTTLVWQQTAMLFLFVISGIFTQKEV